MTTDPIEEIVKHVIRSVENDDSVMNGTVARRAARLAYVAALRAAATIARDNTNGAISTERLLLAEAEFIEGRFHTMDELADRIEKGTQ